MHSSGQTEHPDGGSEPTLLSRPSVLWMRLVLSGWRLVVSGSVSLREWEPLVMEALRARHGGNEMSDSFGLELLNSHPRREAGHAANRGYLNARPFREPDPVDRDQTRSRYSRHVVPSAQSCNTPRFRH